jgi:phytoene desaturase
LRYLINYVSCYRFLVYHIKGDHVVKSGQTATVVGGGFAGLSVSAYLAKQGLEVTLLEKNDTTGGRARYWEEAGYRFDMGPSWYLMPEVFDRFFEDLGATASDYFQLKRLDPYYKTFFNPGESVTVTSDMQRTRELFDTFEPGGGEKLTRYLDASKYKYDVAMSEFLYREYSSIFSFLNRRILTEGLRLHVFTSLDKYVRKYFTDRRARQLLEYAMVFLGTSPHDAPALYSIMSHVDLNLGVFYPSGGLAGVADGFARLASDLGVKIVTGSPVREIEVHRGRAVAVHTDSATYRSDVVVSSADYHHTETDLLPANARSHSARYWERRVMAPSMFIAYLGVNKKLPQLEHHNLYFSQDWDDHFDKIFKQPSWPERPCFYLSCISKTDADSAPSGAENLFLLVPVAPALDDSDAAREQYFDHMLDHVEDVTGTTFRDSVVVKRLYTHRDFSADYNAFKGTALGLAHTLGQTAVFRPAHRSKRVKNLFYTGQYTHPGIGVPMTLIASSIVANEIARDQS